MRRVFIAASATLALVATDEVSADSADSAGNLVDAQASAPARIFAWPICSEIGTRFGYKVDPTTGRVSFYPGIDIAANLGDPVKPAGMGTVLYSKANEEFGLLVEIDHGGRYRTRYGYLSSSTVSAGQTVALGDIIGKVGAPDPTTFPVLHFQVWYNDIVRDPLKHLSLADCEPARESLDRAD
jgi:murein DD-endopeptidase MepM/ murein hydrolase activator NlpD